MNILCYKTTPFVLIVNFDIKQILHHRNNIYIYVLLIDTSIFFKKALKSEFYKKKTIIYENNIEMYINCLYD